ncbi:AcrR family transcriptional regulator [Caulobacter ginsengisoli]|uniref:AcrR family transcriptional regulator n=1 Tax=Caulobacter ginsengisoli TaxID=400775 RepID=A0ABU0IXH9_9CAUL|nr:TetR family transcriptional regulator [Caulobacter ginsengisoli]MDQ0466080.1 AcrR family transcriptional regulator [Caulobacter ginsengisoli]
MSTQPALTNRDRLIAQARRLFSEHGFAAVSVDEVAAAAGLTKGAVYYQFKDKTDLFRAACEAVLADVRWQVDAATMSGGTHALDEIVTGGDKWLDIYETPEVRQMLLIDGPAVLGVEAWMALQEPVGIALIAHALGHLVDAGLLPQAQVAALAHMLFGSFVQATLRIAVAADPQAASREVRAAMRTLTSGLLAGRPA